MAASGHRRLAAEMRPELVAGIAAREIGCGHRHLKKPAQRLPAIRRIKGQQTVGGDGCAHLLVVAPIGPDRAFPVKPPKQIADKQLVHRLEDRGNLGRQLQAFTQAKELADGF